MRSYRANAVARLLLERASAVMEGAAAASPASIGATRVFSSASPAATKDCITALLPRCRSAVPKCTPFSASARPSSLVCRATAARTFSSSGTSMQASPTGAKSQQAVPVGDFDDGKMQTPHGGSLVNLMLPEEKRAAAIASCTKELDMNDRHACDVELLCVGGFSPLTGFLDEEQYNHVVEHMRLKDGLLLGLPVVLDTDREDIQVGDKVLLKYGGKPMATVTIDSKWMPNKPLEALKCYGSTSIEHPAVQMVSMERGKYYIGGAVEGLDLPERPFPCETPEQVRAKLPKGTDVVAFQCRNPIHRAHYELFIRALDAPNVGKDAVCLVHPTCGPTQDDDIPGDIRYRTYQVLEKEVSNPRVRWAYLPYSMHMAGPREAIQHMILRKNYGCTHFIIGRDMAGCKSSLSGEDFYGAYDAQDTANEHSEELGVKTVPSLNIMYTQEKGYVTADIAKAEGLTPLKLSGTKFRKMLRAGEDIPEWFAFSSVVTVLRGLYK